MRLILWVVVVLLAGCGDSGVQDAPPVAVPVPVAVAKPVVDDGRADRLAAALVAVKGEPKVRDASWLDAGSGSLLAGVLDDGSKQDGYAGYLCVVLAEHGVSGGRVRVMDVAAAVRDKWVELGAADCPAVAPGPPEWVDFTKAAK